MKWIKRILIFLVIVSIAISVWILIKVNSASFWEKLILTVSQKNLKDAAIEKISINNVNCYWPIQCVFKQTKLTIKKDKELYYLDIPVLDVLQSADKNAVESWLRTWRVSFSGLNIYSANINVSKLRGNIFLDVQENNDISYKGSVSSPQTTAFKYKINQLSLQIKGNIKKTEISNLLFNFYRGEIRGEILLDNDQNLPYSIHLKLKEVDLESLAKVGPEVLTQMSGRVTGSVDLIGNIRSLKSFQAKLATTGGGSIKAKLLKPLMDYIPETKERKDFDVIFKKDGDVPLEKAELSVVNVSDVKLINQIHLLSRTLNIEPNVTVEVNIDGGLNNFINRVYQSFTN